MFQSGVGFVLSFSGDNMKASKKSIENTVGYHIGRASRALSNRLNKQFTEAGVEVTAEQWSILVHLFEKDGLSQQEIADLAGKDKTSVTRLIHSIEKKQLIERIPDKLDRRSKRVHLTPKCRKLEKTLWKHVNILLQDTQEGVTPEDLEICNKVLKTVYENISK